MSKREIMMLMGPAVTASIAVIAVIFIAIYDRREAKRKKKEAERASQA
jgi:hypothetical protein